MKRQVKILTVTLEIETDCDDMDALEAAVCSNLADLPIDYDCEEDEVNGDGLRRMVVGGRIAIAYTENCRIDAGISEGYEPPATGTERTVIGGRTFVHG